jgi:hypothetical protein
MDRRVAMSSSIGGAMSEIFAGTSEQLRNDAQSAMVQRPAPGFLTIGKAPTKGTS